MSPIASPTRLLLDPGIGPLLRHAANGAVSEARLEYNRHMIEAALASTAAQAGGTMAHFLPKAGSIAKVGIVALGLVAVLVLWRHGGRGLGRNTTPRAVALQPAPTTALAPIPTPMPAPTPAVPETHNTRVASPSPPSRPHTLAMHESGLSGREAKQVPPSSIAAQLELFHTAESKARALRYDEALAILNVLDHRYPHGSLEAEIILSRAEYLWLSGHDSEAADFIEANVNNPVVAARKAELWLTLGDVRQRQGSCPQAVAAYQRALGLGLRPADANAARKGLH